MLVLRRLANNPGERARDPWRAVAVGDSPRNLAATAEFLGLLPYCCPCCGNWKFNNWDVDDNYIIDYPNRDMGEPIVIAVNIARRFHDIGDATTRFSYAGIVQNQLHRENLLVEIAEIRRDKFNTEQDHRDLDIFEQYVLHAPLQLW